MEIPDKEATCRIEISPYSLFLNKDSVVEMILFLIFGILNVVKDIIGIRIGLFLIQLGLSYKNI